MNPFSLFIHQASAHAAEYDALFYSMLALSLGVALAVTVTAVIFMFRYRHRAGTPRLAPPERAHAVELAWIVIPLVLFVGIFLWAARLYADLFYPPSGAMTVYVVAKQWMWRVQHANGRREYDELHVPRGRPVALLLTSEDVIHSLSLPALRLKRDVLPGGYTTVWFNADRAGEYHLYCAEYCGTGHAHMRGRFIVMEPGDFADWLAAGATAGLAAEGERLFRQFGCSGCHGASASVRAPRLEGVFGSPVPLQDGGLIVADETYLRDSILLPRKHVVAGFDPIMPSFRDQLAEDDILRLVAYIKSLGRAEGEATP